MNFPAQYQGIDLSQKNNDKFLFFLKNYLYLKKNKKIINSLILGGKTGLLRGKIHNELKKLKKILNVRVTPMFFPIVQCEEQLNNVFPSGLYAPLQ